MAVVPFLTQLLVASLAAFGGGEDISDDAMASAASPVRRGGAPPPPAKLTGHKLPAPAVCMNGCPAEVNISKYLNVSLEMSRKLMSRKMSRKMSQVLSVVRDPDLWVITLGELAAPGGTGFCLSGEACAWEAVQPWNR
eukprot:SAG31_NODE_12346_length_948_cov_1.332155_1_plen_138_part_00